MIRALTMIIILLGLVRCATAQQKPQYTQYLFNNYLLNPAFAGIENYVDVKLGHRTQWAGIEGKPVSNYLTINAPLGEGFLNGGEGSGNPSQRSFMANYRSAEPHHGIGLQLQSDKAGLITQTNIAATYAYHIGLSNTLNLSAGINAGISQYSLNTALVTTENPDQSINAGNFGKWNPDATFGLLLYGKDFFAGFSAHQLILQQLFNNNTNKSNTVPHFFFTTGFRAYFTEDINITPSVVIKTVRPAPITFDVNVKMAFRDIFWIGGSYRRNDSFGTLVGFNLSSLINVGYAYDSSVSSLNTVSNGSHELVLGITLSNKYQVRCPQRNF